MEIRTLSSPSRSLYQIHKLTREAKMIERIAIFLFAAALLAAGPAPAAAELRLSSPAFKDGAEIPAVHARSAGNVSIPLKWTGAPEGTKSFALSIVDHHPVAGKWAHWMAINIPPDVTSLPQGASGKSMPPGSIETRNSFGDLGYGGPQPPRGTGAHQYVVTLYALKDARLVLKPDATLSDFQAAIKGKVLGEASITGLFGK
jgi:Raf kinase inhibitor-like YbhB/YbcL family protein